MSTWGIKQYAFAIGAVGLALFVLWYGHTRYQSGITEAQNLCESEKLKALLDAYQESAVNQQFSDALAATAETELQKYQNAQSAKEVELLDERKNNRAYNDCIVPDNGVSLYNSGISEADSR